LAMLGMRSALARADGCLVIAANEETADRLADGLRLDDVLGAASSRADALAEVRREDAEPRRAGAWCHRCRTTWHPRCSPLLSAAGTHCPRCGEQLHDRGVDGGEAEPAAVE